MAPVRIAFLSSEVAPFTKTGGLADVALNGMKEDFSWDNQAERYLAIYRELLIN